MNFTKVLRAAEVASRPRNPPFNPYKARKPWPPDFSKLDHKYQFRLERRYRRRTKLKWERPGWIRGVKLANWVICSYTAMAFSTYEFDMDPEQHRVFKIARRRDYFANFIKQIRWSRLKQRSIYPAAADRIWARPLRQKMRMT
ncbi:MAG: hypothetical protein Q9170_007404 [Blastenia crenularia]